MTIGGGGISSLPSSGKGIGDYGPSQVVAAVFLYIYIPSGSPPVSSHGMDGSALDEGTHVVLQDVQKAHTCFAGGLCYVWCKKDVWSREKGILWLLRFVT